MERERVRRREWSLIVQRNGERDREGEDGLQVNRGSCVHACSLTGSMKGQSCCGVYGVGLSLRLLLGNSQTCFLIGQTVGERTNEIRQKGITLLLTVNLALM